MAGLGPPSGIAAVPYTHLDVYKRQDPDRMQGNPQPPPVSIERLLVDGVDMDPQAAGRLGPGVERLELHFAAMSYVAPSAVRYRYRPVSYTHLDVYKRQPVPCSKTPMAGCGSACAAACAA